jgi:hypothetical protein
MIFAGIILLGNVQTLTLGDQVELLIENPTVKLTINLMRYSPIPYYLIVAVLIRYIYQVNYLYSALSVAVPIGAIWSITELVNFSIK